MRYRYQVDFVFTDMVRFPGEASADTRIYDIEAEDIFEGHKKVRLLSGKVKVQCFPMVKVEVKRQRFLGALCKHCIGTGMEGESETKECPRQD